MPAFSKSSVYKGFPSTQKRKLNVFKFLRFDYSYRRAPFTWLISVDGRPSHRNLVIFSNFVGVVRALPSFLHENPS